MYTLYIKKYNMATKGILREGKVINNWTVTVILQLFL